MAGNSLFYKRLIKRIDIIEANYFPPIKPMGNYTLKEQDDIRAYSFLIHAELEYYFEEIARKKSKDALNKWVSNNNYRSTILMSLSCFHNDSAGKKKLREILEVTLKFYHNNLNRNNGIKEQNILDILLPLGILYDDIDNTWLTTISSFGSERGKIAHTAARVQVLQDPNDIRRNVGYILSELKPLDKKIRQLR